MIRKLIVLVLALAMALCAVGYAEVTPKGEYPITTEAVTLKIAMPVNAKVEDITTNKFTLWTQESTGVNLEFIVLPSVDTMTKVNLMFASNDLADVFTGVGFSYLNLIDYSGAGYIIPLDDYIAEYGENIFRAYEECTNPYVEQLLRLPDGKIYAMPAIVEASSNTWNNRIWIYEPWLEQLGRDMPETIDELYELLVAMKNADLNGNGKADESPMMTCGDGGNVISFFGNAFQHTDTDTFLDLNDGVASFIAGNEDYRTTLEFLHKLVAEGLFNPVSFTQDAAQLKAIIAAEDASVGIVPYKWKSGFADVTSERGREYIVVPPLKGPTGYVTTTTGLPAVTYSYVITKDCVVPEIAYRLADFWESESSSMYGRYGERGVEWDWADAGTVGNNGEAAYFKILDDVWGKASCNAIWYNDSRAAFLNVHDRLQSAGDPYEYNFQIMLSSLNDYAAVAKPEFLPTMPMNEADSEEYGTLRLEIVNYVKENSVRFILGDRSFDEWDAYVSEFDALGVEAYVDLINRVYQTFIGA